MKYQNRDIEEFFKIKFLDRYMEGHDGFIAGGCFKNIFCNERVKDVDIFFETEDDFLCAVDYFDDSDKFNRLYENQNTIAFTDTKTKMQVELIRSSFGTPEQILTLFDFSITKFAYYKKEVESSPIDIKQGKISEPTTHIEYKVMHHCFFFEHLLMKKLVLEEDIKFPVSTFERSYRYKGYGFNMCKNSKENLLRALQGANLNDLSKSLYFGLD